MTLTHLLVFSALAPLARFLFRAAARPWLMLAGSVLAVYWLQPLTPIRYLDFWLPTASLALTIWVWCLTQPAPGSPASARRASEPSGGQAASLEADRRTTALTAAVVALLVLLVGLARYFGPLCCFTPARPPGWVSVTAGLVLVAGVALALARLKANRWLWGLGLGGLLALFVVLKAEPLARAASGALRGLAGQAPELAAAGDLRWLGFSYLAFRLIHVLRDRALGRLPQVSLREFITYAVFFPAFTAGPIDRLERFIKDCRQPFGLSSAVVLDGGARLAVGVLKKFVLADSLALVALNAANAGQAASPAWLWVLVYAYAWRLFLDFSGYTDIAIGLGRFFGFRLPENFDRPYLRQNLTLFWNSWHITLAQWFRTYVFNPLTRALRARPLPAPIIILLTQMVTMVLIGLWHGVTWNFAIWGAWHGLGLFVHNRWADFTKPRAALLEGRPNLKRAARVAGLLLTFHYVALGWVWFALPTPDLALRVLGRLVGF
jgi:D-alanyl-lipoteichoic acid acyltransferase DltB (MBOAT superfamily)